MDKKCHFAFFFHREECSNKGGTEDGSCANGYGVCCSCEFFFSKFWNMFRRYFFLFTVVSACGAVIAENNTYFESEGEEKSHCSISVCKASDSIVQVNKYNSTMVSRSCKSWIKGWSHRRLPSCEYSSVL